MSNTNMATLHDSTLAIPKFIDHIYNNKVHMEPQRNINLGYMSSTISISHSNTNENGESNIFSYGYSNIDDVEREIYYGGKFNKNNSREELGKSSNKSDFKIKRITNKNKPDESLYEFTKPHYNNINRSLAFDKTISSHNSNREYLLQMPNMKNIFNDPFFTNL